MLWQTFIVTLVLVVFYVLPLFLSCKIAKDREVDFGFPVLFTFLFSWLGTGIVWLTFKGRTNNDLFVCSACAHVGRPRFQKRGSSSIEILLLLFVLPLGMVYSVWRSRSQYPICPFCRHSNLSPATSPIGKKLISELQQAAADYSAS